MRLITEKLPLILTAAYLLGAVVVWVDFARLPPDGLANSGIALYTLPVMLAVMFLTKREFPFFEGNYYPAHALYFAVSVAALAAVIYIVARAVMNALRRRTGEPT